ncbi:MAG: LppX_LprAFG lipoprotein [Candidatus Dormibacteraeota bacterium]|nr:LppX_LprAFG lipoprotein [Candidatus Dormibacteraeota bacterium]
MIGRIRAARLGAVALALLAITACGGLQPEDPGQALREGGAAMAKLKTISANLKFTQGKISFQGYVLVGAKATVRLPTDSDTIYTVRYQDLLIGLEVVISGGHVYLRPPLSGFTEVTGKNAADIPDVAKLFDLKTGLPAIIPAGTNPKYIGADKVGDVDSHKVSVTYTAAQIQGLLPQLKSSGDVTATIWVGGSDHLIRKAILEGPFGDLGAASSVEVDLSGFDGAVTIASPTP